MDATEPTGINYPLLTKNLDKFNLIDSIASLRRNPRDFWILMILEFLSLIPFSITTMGSFMYNTRILGFVDSDAGMIMGGVGISVAVSSILISSFPVKYGVKFCLATAGVLGALINALLYLDLNRYIQLGMTFLILIPSLALTFISLKLGFKQYTYAENRSVGYSMFYMILFISAVIGSFILDGILTLNPVDLDAFHVAFIVCVIIYIALFLLSLTVRNLDIEHSGETEIELNREQNSWKYIKEVMVTGLFWRFFAFIILLTVVKSMYFHLSLTLPIYMDRSIERRAHFSYIMAVHQIALLICVPLLTGLLRYFDSYSLIVIGSTISIFSPLALLLGNSYYTLGIFVVFLSIGESIYSPRLLDYTIESAPKGKESVFLALANMPNSLGLLITGISSGYFMANFCPEEGDTQDCFLVWLLIGAYCVIPGLILAFGRRMFQKHN